MALKRDQHFKIPKTWIENVKKSEEQKVEKNAG